MTIVPKSNEGPGFWSLSGTVTLTSGSARVPKAGTLNASGSLGVVSVVSQPAGTIRTEIAAAPGVLKITWSAGPQPEPPTKATVVHVMTHPIHTLTGVVTSGFGRYGVIVGPLRHKPNNNITGQLILVGSGTIDK